MMVLVMLSWGALTAAANIMISQWCDKLDTDNNTDLYIYIGLSLSSLIFVGIRTYGVVMAIVRLGRFLHKRVLKSLLYASLTQFYNRVPIGRILNRLSKDLRQIDE